MTAPAPPVHILLQQPKEPYTFRGSSFEEPKSRLETYYRVAALNSWDINEKLRRIYFYLEDVAKTWFENREPTLHTWNVFRTTFLNTFTSVVCKEHAASALEIRVHLPDEGVNIFAEEMTWLFHHANPNMIEEKKVSFFMRGVKQELFTGLIRNLSKTVAEFALEAFTIEKTLEMRTRQFNRSFSAAQALGATDLRETIRAIVQEELRKLLPSVQPYMDSIADVVRQEIQQSLGSPQLPQPQVKAMSYAAAARHQVPLPRLRRGTASPQFPRETTSRPPASS